MRRQTASASNSTFSTRPAASGTCWQRWSGLPSRGVDCKILADDFGAKPFFRSRWPRRLEKAGVKIVRSLRVNLFSSLFRRSDLRNHRKILVCDQHVGYVGSYNLADPKLFKADRGVGEWVDMMMRVEGPVVDALTSVCLSDYLFDSMSATRSDAPISMPCRSNAGP